MFANHNSEVFEGEYDYSNAIQYARGCFHQPDDWVNNQILILDTSSNHEEPDE
jgi:hypothetical protein